MVGSPLRYPGGKSRAVGRILERFPANFDAFREPFVGGGSVFIAVRQRFPNARVWINDLNADLVAFWTMARDENAPLIRDLRLIRGLVNDGWLLFEFWRGYAPVDAFERALRFFVLNRISFSGTTDSGGYSSHAFQSRFTDSSIERVARLEGLLEGVKITNLDFEGVLLEPGEDVFAFLDPPYAAVEGSRLYGKSGDLHAGFDHTRLARTVHGLPYPWLMTYDDSSQIRTLYADHQLEAWQLQYGMNNVGGERAARGREVFVSNLPSMTPRPQSLARTAHRKSASVQLFDDDATPVGHPAPRL
ncbi:MAG: DNA adenine methylase [Pleurocapsa sp. SU_196_0]|nr:DNA adenine methylase [Pleurocapsa sp. SU_196_0]